MSPRASVEMMVLLLDCRMAVHVFQAQARAVGRGSRHARGLRGCTLALAWQGGGTATLGNAQQGLEKVRRDLGRHARARRGTALGGRRTLVWLGVAILGADEVEESPWDATRV